MIGSYPFTHFLFSPFNGSWSDKVGRRPLILGGLIGYALATLLFSISTNLIALYAFRLLVCLSSAVFLTAFIAYISDKTTVDTRGRGISLSVSAAAFGAVAGSLLGTLFSDISISLGPLQFDKFSFPFLISSVLVLLVFVFLLFTLTESHQKKAHLYRETNETEKESLLLFFKPAQKTTVSLLLFSFIIQLALAMFEGTFALHSERLFAFGPQEMSAVFIVCGSVMGVLSLGPVAWLIKKHGESALLPYGLIVLGLGMSLLMFSEEMGFILIYVSFVSAGIAILYPCLAALIIKASGDNHGASSGVFNSINALGQVSGVVFGSIMLIWFEHLPYLLVSIILLGAAFLSKLYTGHFNRGSTAKLEKIK